MSTSALLNLLKIYMTLM